MQRLKFYIVLTKQILQMPNPLQQFSLWKPSSSLPWCCDWHALYTRLDTGVAWKFTIAFYFALLA